MPHRFTDVRRVKAENVSGIVPTSALFERFSDLSRHPGHATW